jgi:hypothetical protein
MNSDTESMCFPFSWSKTAGPLPASQFMFHERRNWIETEGKECLLKLKKITLRKPQLPVYFLLIIVISNPEKWNFWEEGYSSERGTYCHPEQNPGCFE